MEGHTTAEQENRKLWDIFLTHHSNIFNNHVVPKLNGNDVKFFYDVNSESRRAIQKSSNARLPDAFEIGDFETTSTISWALEKCSEEKERFCWRMAQNGNLELLQFLHENGCPWNESTCSGAAHYGHVGCLKYAHENRCPWDKGTCACAAYNGHLECLKYLHENGCPWHEYTCEYAAKNGHLECLQYAHENGCPWNERTCSEAARNDHFECLKYAHENGCPGSANYAHHLPPA